MINFRDYIEYAEKQVLFAEAQAGNSSDVYWALIPAITLSWSAMESFVNNRLDDFATLPESMLQLHERAFLIEKKIKLINTGDKLGQFTLDGTEYNRLENKIFFLIAKFGGHELTKVKKGDSLWQRFEEFKDIRDALVHPRQDREISLNINKVKECIDTSKDIIKQLSENIWKKKIEF